MSYVGKYATRRGFSWRWSKHDWRRFGADADEVYGWIGFIPENLYWVGQESAGGGSVDDRVGADGLTIINTPTMGDPNQTSLPGMTVGISATSYLEAANNAVFTDNGVRNFAHLGYRYIGGGTGLDDLFGKGDGNEGWRCASVASNDYLLWDLFDSASTGFPAQISVAHTDIWTPIAAYVDWDANEAGIATLLGSATVDISAANGAFDKMNRAFRLGSQAAGSQEGTLIWHARFEREQAAWSGGVAERIVARMAAHL